VRARRRAKPTARPREIVEVTVERLGARGDGIAHDGGRRLYLPQTVPGDRVRAALGEPRGDGVAAHLLEVLAPGAGRAAPACRHFGSCGGCAFQHLDAAAYDRAKRALLRDALARHGLGGVEIRPGFRVAPGTRRRARITLARGRGDAVSAGFNERGSHAVLDLAECPVLRPELVSLLGPLRAVARRLLDPGASAAAMATLTESGVDLLLELPGVPGLAALEALAELAETADLARLAWTASGEGEPVLASLRRPVRVVLGGIPVEPPIGSFLQATGEAEAAMAARVGEIVGTADPVGDLFAGIGAFAFALGGRARVHAVEGAVSAVAAVGRAAAANGLAARVTAERRDLEQRPLEGDELARFAAVVFDPPRAGAKAQSRALAASPVPVIAAVSCNPATFARDARTLVDGGYRLAWIEPVDQFLWSPHLELVAKFERYLVAR
jgi:23S rRNA (uracil1939-C5)-methyltransferase